MRFLEEWGGRLSQGNLLAAYADTLEPAQRSTLPVQGAGRLVLFNMAAGSLPHQGVPGALLSSMPALEFTLARETQRAEIFKLLSGRHFFIKDKLQGPDEEVRTSSEILDERDEHRWEQEQP